MHRWLKISSDFLCIYEIIAGGRGSASDPLGKLTTLPKPQLGHPTARACGARTLRFAPLAIVPDCGAQIMVTLL